MRALKSQHCPCEMCSLQLTVERTQNTEMTSTFLNGLYHSHSAAGGWHRARPSQSRTPEIQGADVLLQIRRNPRQLSRESRGQRVFALAVFTQRAPPSADLCTKGKEIVSLTKKRVRRESNNSNANKPFITARYALAAQQRCCLELKTNKT